MKGHRSILMMVGSVLIKTSLAPVLSLLVVHSSAPDIKILEMDMTFNVTYTFNLHKFLMHVFSSLLMETQEAVLILINFLKELLRVGKRILINSSFLPGGFWHGFFHEDL